MSSLNGVEFAIDLILLAAGVVMLALAAYLTVQSLRQCRWRRATGSIVGYRSEEDAEFPVVEFDRGDGEMVRFTSTVGRGRRSRRTTVPVRYDPERPERAEVGTFMARWLFPLALLGLALVFILGTLSQMRDWFD